MKKQTAIEFFQNEIIKIVNGESTFSEIELFEKAMEIEKAQIIDAHLAGQNSSEEINGQTEIEYYNETF